MNHIHWTRFLASCMLLFGLASSTPAFATEPVYSLDLLQHHPYRFQPAYGHASQRPGSPRHFVPGYGYQSPGFGQSSIRAGTSYRSNYSFGRRLPHSLYKQFRHDTNSLGGPWYHPGWPGNVQLQPQAW